MEEKEVIGVLDGLLSKGVSESEIIEYKTNLFDKEMFGKYISALSNVAALYDEKWAYIFWGIEDITLRVLGTHFDPFNHKIPGTAELLIPWLSKMTGQCGFEFKKFSYEGKDIVALLVPAAKWVDTKFKGTAYIRVDSTTTTLYNYPEKKRLLWSKLVRGTFEDDFAMTAKSADEVLNLLDFSIYYQALDKKIPTNSTDVLLMLKHEDVLRRR